MTDHSLPWKLKRCLPSAWRDGWVGHIPGSFGQLGLVVWEGKEGRRLAIPPSLPPLAPKAGRGRIVPQLMKKLMFKETCPLCALRSGRARI